MVISFAQLKTPPEYDIPPESPQGGGVQNVDQWVASMQCGKSIIRHLDVTVLCDQFFLVTLPAGTNEAFWVFIHKTAERLLTFNPFWSRGADGNILKFEQGWVRFEKPSK